MSADVFYGRCVDAYTNEALMIYDGRIREIQIGTTHLCCHKMETTQIDTPIRARCAGAGHRLDSARHASAQSMICGGLVWCARLIRSRCERAREQTDENVTAVC